MTLGSPGDDGTRRVRLADGRVLAIIEYGDLKGRPVFYFHGTPSCRYEGWLAAEAAVREGVRLIAVDRPGLGRSSWQERRRLVDWAGDVAELADLLGLGRFGIAGHSGGGAFVFATASVLAERLDFAIAFCPWGPPEPDGAGLNRLDRMYFQLARLAPDWMLAAFSPLALAGRRFPELFVALLGRAVSAPDRAVLRRPAIRARFVRMLREAFAEGGRGAAWEALICYQPWGFALGDIRCPVHVWFGDEDVFVPPEMAARIERELKQPVVRRLANTGHLGIEHWQEVFAAACGAATNAR